MKPSTKLVLRKAAPRIAGFIVGTFICALFTWPLWNMVVVPITGFATISYLKTVCLLFTISFLLGPALVHLVREP